MIDRSVTLTMMKRSMTVTVWMVTLCAHMPLSLTSAFTPPDYRIATVGVRQNDLEGALPIRLTAPFQRTNHLSRTNLNGLFERHQTTRRRMPRSNGLALTMKLDNDGFSEGTDSTSRTGTSVLNAAGGVSVENNMYQQAILRTLVWVGLAGAFGAGLWTFVGPETGEEFFAGYLLEQSLSVDNLFVFLLLFDFFRVPLSSQEKVLSWGIYGSIVMRAIMIWLGAAALENFHAILLVFAGVLVYSSGKILFDADDDEDDDLNDSAIVKFSRRLIDSTDRFDGDNFFTVIDGVRKATPLFICMIAVEISDIVFAVDSVPAVFGVTEVSNADRGGCGSLLS